MLMGEVHEGICGAHQSSYKIKWIIRRSGYFWPTILEDCFEYYRGVRIVNVLVMFKNRPHRL